MEIGLDHLAKMVPATFFSGIVTAFPFPNLFESTSLNPALSQWGSSPPGGHVHSDALGFWEEQLHFTSAVFRP